MNSPTLTNIHSLAQTKIIPICKQTITNRTMGIHRSFYPHPPMGIFSFVGRDGQNEKCQCLRLAPIDFQAIFWANGKIGELRRAILGSIEFVTKRVNLEGS